MVPWNSALGGFAYNWQSRWVGIFAIKTERTQIDFLSDVLLLPSPLWTLKYLITTQVRLMIFRLAAWSDRHTIEKKFINNEHLILHINWWFLPEHQSLYQIVSVLQCLSSSSISRSSPRVSSLIRDVLFLLLLVAPHSIVFCDT